MQYYPDIDSEDSLGMLGEGTITLTEASTDEGAAVIGDISGSLIDGLF
ncbi:MAG: hypothetical protein GY854_27325 [Deltaproteobacteria bacterium]|nr:hypothetical protein [Deltaproteobacteria bacterium]